MSEHNYTHESLASSEPATSTADTDGDSRQSTVPNWTTSHGRTRPRRRSRIFLFRRRRRSADAIGSIRLRENHDTTVDWRARTPKRWNHQTGRPRPADVDGTFVPPEERGIGLVFQDFALFPHLTAAENVDSGSQSGPRASVRPASSNCSTSSTCRTTATIARASSRADRNSASRSRARWHLSPTFSCWTNRFRTST